MPADFPFSALVAQDDLRLGLLLNAVSPAIGGVLIRGEKGTAKSTAARGLAHLLPEIEVVDGCPFNCDPDAPNPDCPAGPHAAGSPRARRRVPLVELPIGASTDRITGSLDLERALVQGQRAFEPGLLAAAHRGILYVDEVNLLADHLVDVLLDTAALGTNYVERDGISVRHPSRYILIGTMNPEEGELRPQLLDRFGITVTVTGSAALDERAEVVRRRMAFELDPDGFNESYRETDAAVAVLVTEAQRRLPNVTLPDAMLEQIVRVCAGLGVDGMRADIVTGKTAVAFAAWEGRTVVELDDVRRAVLLALPHRRRRGPFEKPGIDLEELENLLEAPGIDPEPPTGPPSGPGQAVNGATDPGGTPAQSGATQAGTTTSTPSEAASGANTKGDSEATQWSDLGSPFGALRLQLLGKGTGAPGRRSDASSEFGNAIGDAAMAGKARDVSILGTLRAAAPSQQERGRAAGEQLQLRQQDLRRTVREHRESNLVLFAVDASGSMGHGRRMEVTKGAILSLLLDAYQLRDRVGLITFRGDQSYATLPPTSDVMIAAECLRRVRTGGNTPLAAGLQHAHEILTVEALRDPSRRQLLVLLTDGMPNVGDPNPVYATIRAATALANRRVATIVVDTEWRKPISTMNREISRILDAPCLRIEELGSSSLAGVVRKVLGRHGSITDRATLDQHGAA
jgi:magnesium chelatase subunit D